MTKCGACGKKANTIPCNHCEKRLCKKCRTPFFRGYSGVTAARCTDADACMEKRRADLQLHGVRFGTFA